MKAITLLSAAVAALLTWLLPASPARALPQSYVSSTGNGTACTRMNPCVDLLFAVNATDAGGIIYCLDSGPFSGVGSGSPINKSITIDCSGARLFTVTVSAPGIVVKLRNLTVNGAPNSVGIDFINGAALFIENCVINNITDTPGVGIRFRPSASGSQLVMTDTVISNSGNGSAGGGIIVQPQAGGTAQVALDRVTVGKNVFGIAVDGNGSTGGINMTISDSVISGNSQDGIIATTPSGGAPIGVMVKNTKSINNAGFGIRSIGPNVTIRVDGSTVTGNSTGLSFNFFGTGGALLSFGNNNVEGNGTNGAFSGPVALK